MLGLPAPPSRFVIPLLAKRVMKSGVGRAKLSGLVASPNVRKSLSGRRCYGAYEIWAEISASRAQQGHVSNISISRHCHVYEIVDQRSGQ